MAGKSELILSILRRFNPVWATKPLTSIIYCARGSVPQSYLTALRQVATELHVKLYVFEHGVTSESFKSTFARALRKRQISERQTDHQQNKNEEFDRNNDAKSPINNDNDDNDDDDNDEDDDDDDDDDDDNNNNDENHNGSFNSKRCQNPNDKECRRLLTDMIQTKRPRATAQHKVSNVHKLSQAHNSLNAKPKMTSMRKIKKFLTLNDRSMKRSRHIALSKGKTLPVTRLNDASIMTGGVLTRSKSRLLGHDTLDTHHHHSSVHKESKGRNDKNNVNDTSLDNVTTHTPKTRDNDPPPSLDASSVLFRNAKETSDGNKQFPLKEEDENKCEWLPGSILLLDDHLCFSSVQPPAFKTSGGASSASYTSASSTSKQRREEQSEILQFIQSMSTLYSHHMNIHLVATRCVVIILIS